MPKTASFDLYGKSRSPRLDRALFENPTAEYRGTPFWSWNTKLDREQLFRQIDCFKRMGLGGFHIHSRTGLDTEYLGDEWMALVRACTEKARDDGMLSWLYDEDRWPSGAAGGLVTKDHRHRAKHLLFTTTPYKGITNQNTNSNSIGSRNENGTLLARYDVHLEHGLLARYRKLEEGESPAPGGRVWYAYLETAAESPWYNNQTYVDTLSRPAIERFIEITHEAYQRSVGEFFGSVIPAIFTDEPQFVHKKTFRNADDVRDVFLPFTTDFLDTYAQTYKQRLEDYLPELFWELPDGKASAPRYRYHDHCCERFASAFADTIGEWCGKHGIALTGHMMEEPRLWSQTASLGETMRSYRAFHIPGIDMLCDWREYTTAKQAQSAVHQYGRCGMLSELYGVTNWDFDFVGHKAQGDWQAALGVTVRVPHLSWVSMAGEAKRDYPASISYQSPWHEEYKLIEDHFARVNVALTRGKPLVRVGVIHPVESYWLSWGPEQQTKLSRDEQEQNFKDVNDWLIFGLVDFNFISESLLPTQATGETGAKTFGVGEMAYDAIVVPALRTIRSTTLDRLEKFADAGGAVLFAGRVPDLVDAMPSDRARKLAARTCTIALSRTQLLSALDPFRELDLRHVDGVPSDALLSQLRVDGDGRLLFLCNTDRKRWRDCRVRVKGEWQPTLLDTLDGSARALGAEYHDGWTQIPWNFTPHGHLLLSLEPGRSAQTKPVIAIGPEKWLERARIADPVAVTLSEPNVLLLDQADWRLDGGPWQGIEEILRLDTAARARLGLRGSAEHMAQPWTDREPAVRVATLELKFVIQSEVNVAAPMLAIEDADTTRLRLNGKEISSKSDGWWVDECIRTVKLPPLTAGTHELIVEIPLTRKTNVEWCYLLGDFGVRVAGRRATLTAPVKQLSFGDWTSQGLPFYAGNVTYHCTVNGDGTATQLEASRFSAPLLVAAVDGKRVGPIAFAPFRLDLGKLAPGEHKLDLTAYGNRVNAFGAIHNIDETTVWWGPNSYRTKARDWSYEYQLHKTGILAAPVVLRT